MSDIESFSNNYSSYSQKKVQEDSQILNKIIQFTESTYDRDRHYQDFNSGQKSPSIEDYENDYELQQFQQSHHKYKNDQPLYQDQNEAQTYQYLQEEQFQRQQENLLNSSSSAHQQKHFNDIMYNGNEEPIQIIEQEDCQNNGMSPESQMHSEQKQNMQVNSTKSSNLLSGFINSNSLNFSHLQHKPQIQTSLLYQESYYPQLHTQQDHNNSYGNESNRLLQQSYQNQSKVNRLLIDEKDNGDIRQSVQVKNRLMETELTNLRYKINQLESKLNTHSQMTQDYFNKEPKKKIDYYSERFTNPGEKINETKDQQTEDLNQFNSYQNQDLYDKPLQMMDIQLINNKTMDHRKPIVKKSILKNKTSSLRVRTSGAQNSARGLSSERQTNQEIKDLKGSQNHQCSRSKRIETLHSIDLTNKENQKGISSTRRKILKNTASRCRSKSKPKDQQQKEVRQKSMRLKTPKHKNTQSLSKPLKSIDQKLSQQELRKSKQLQSQSKKRTQVSYDLHEPVTIDNFIDKQQQPSKQTELQVLKLKKKLKEKELMIQELIKENQKLQSKLDESEKERKKQKKIIMKQEKEIEKLNIRKNKK